MPGEWDSTPHFRCFGETTVHASREALAAAKRSKSELMEIDSGDLQQAVNRSFQRRQITADGIPENVVIERVISMA